jgi:hypothetical protein
VPVYQAKGQKRGRAPHPVGTVGTGKGNLRNAPRELLKVYQDTGIAILVLDLNDLERVVDGANLIQLLRTKYEHVRLDTLLARHSVVAWAESTTNFLSSTIRPCRDAATTAPPRS